MLCHTNVITTVRNVQFLPSLLLPQGVIGLKEGTVVHVLKREMCIECHHYCQECTN